MSPRASAALALLLWCLPTVHSYAVDDEMRSSGRCAPSSDAFVVLQLMDADGTPVVGWARWADGPSSEANAFGCIHLPLPEAAPPWLLVFGHDEHTDFLTFDERPSSPVELLLPAADDVGFLETRTRRRPETARTTAGTTVLDRERLASAPARTSEELLRHVPGLTLVQHGSEGKGHQFFLRGFDAVHGADLAITLHGIPLNEASHVHGQGYVDLGLLPHDHVHDLVVIRGPFSLHQGPFAMAGSSDFRLGAYPHHLPGGVTTQLRLGTTGRLGGAATWAPPSSHGTRMLALDAVTDQGFGANRSLQRGTALSHWRLATWSARGEASLLVAATAARFEVPGTVRNEDVAAGRMGFTGSYQDGNGGTAHRALLALLLQGGKEPFAWNARLWATARDMELTENFTGWLLNAEEGDRRRQTHRTMQAGADAETTLSLSADLDWISGAGLVVEAVAQTERPVDVEGTSGALERDLSGTQLLGHVRQGLVWQPIDPFSVRAGARLDVFSGWAQDNAEHDHTTRRGAQTLPVVTPRTSLQWQASDTLELLAAWGHGVRPPELRAIATGDPEVTGLDGERVRGREPAWTRSQATEAGARWRPIDALELRLTGFATFIEHEQVYDHVSGRSLALNATRRKGGEAEIVWTPDPRWRLSTDLTLVDARFRDSGALVPFAPRQVGGVRAQGRVGEAWRVGVRYLWVGPRPLPHGARGTTLHQVDITLGWAHKRWRLDLDVENLLGLDLRAGEYHYASHWRPGEPASALPVLHTSAGAPRNARLQLSASF